MKEIGYEEFCECWRRFVVVLIDYKKEIRRKGAFIGISGASQTGQVRSRLGSTISEPNYIGSQTQT